MLSEHSTHQPLHINCIEHARTSIPNRYHGPSAVACGNVANTLDRTQWSNQQLYIRMLERSWAKQHCTSTDLDGMGAQHVTHAMVAAQWRHRSSQLQWFERSAHASLDKYKCMNARDALHFTPTMAPVSANNQILQLQLSKRNGSASHNTIWEFANLGIRELGACGLNTHILMQPESNTQYVFS